MQWDIYWRKGSHFPMLFIVRGTGPMWLESFWHKSHGSICCINQASRQVWFRKQWTNFKMWCVIHLNWIVVVSWFDCVFTQKATNNTYTLSQDALSHHVEKVGCQKVDFSATVYCWRKIIALLQCQIQLINSALSPSFVVGRVLRLRRNTLWQSYVDSLCYRAGMDILGKGGLFPAPPLKDYLTGLTGSSARVGTGSTYINSLTVAVWPTSRQWPDLKTWPSLNASSHNATNDHKASSVIK